MNFFCIGDEDTVLGFRLAGVEGRVAETITESREALKVATSMSDVGIIIITERVAQQIRTDVDKYVYGTDFPLIIEIPDRAGPLPERKPIPELVKQAVGVKI